MASPNTHHPMQDYRLPPGVSAFLKPVRGGTVYIFRHIHFGELGRLAFMEVRGGKVQITSEVIGNPADPVTQKHRAMLEPLCRALVQIMETTRMGSWPTATLPPCEPQPTGMDGCEEVHCEICGAMVALLIVAPGATDESRFEDYAREMYPHYSRHNVPTYIIGPSFGTEPLRCRPANILQVWPERAPIECLQPDEFNPRLVQLTARHCMRSLKHSPGESG